jgi:peptidyl-prolyl cis-trans isomerase A (cyclophilin A)
MKALLTTAFCMICASAFAQAPPAAAPPAREPGLYATIHTSMGDIVIQLFEKDAPKTVANFVDLATGKKEWTDPATKEKTRRPLFDGTTFHRVIPFFMIQGGDPLGTGEGGPGYEFQNEDSDLRFDRPGRVAMANSGRDTNGSQFFITVAPQPHLNGGYTIFGQVVEGQDVAEKISEVDRDEHDKPLQTVTIKNITVEHIK